jgi:hypothetical protein
LLYVLSQPVQDVQGIARQDPFPKADDIAVVIVFGGLDENDRPDARCCLVS